jgi:hypothetical protein
MLGIPSAGRLLDTASVPRFGQLGSFGTFDPAKLGLLYNWLPATDCRLLPFGFVCHGNLPEEGDLA